MQLTWPYVTLASRGSAPQTKEWWREGGAQKERKRMFGGQMQEVKRLRREAAKDGIFMTAHCSRRSSAERGRSVAAVGKS